MANQNGEATGANGAANEASNEERDYVVSGPESQAEKAERENSEKAKAKEAAKSEADEDDLDDDDEGDDDEPKAGDKARKPKRGGFQKKIARLEAEIAALKNGQSGTKSETSTKSETPKAAEKPKPEDFQTWDDYNEALTDWKVDQKLAKRDEDSRTAEKTENFKKSQKTKAERYEQGVAEVKEMDGYEDFDEVIEDYDGPLTIGMQQALLDSEIGPQVAYYLAKNPKEAEKLSKMSLIELNKAIGRIEAKIEKSSNDDPGEGDEDEGKAKKAAKTTKSPPPISPVKASAKSKKDPDDQSYEEYLQERQKRRG